MTENAIGNAVEDDESLGLDGFGAPVGLDELRDALPPPAIPTTLVRATKTQPPYVTDELVSGLSERPTFALIDFDCDHMVAQALPAETATVIREALG